MKTKIFIVLFFVAFLNKSHAQETTLDSLPKKGIQEISLSVYTGTFFSTPEFKVPIFTLAPSINLYTLKTHHHFQYDLVNESLGVINGYYLGKYDIYNMILRSPDSWYLSLGLERYFEIGENMGALFFVEIGTDFHQSRPSATIGGIYEFTFLKN